MSGDADFRLYHSNSLEVLAGLLAEELRAPAPGQPLLAPDTILIPQVAMRRWLQATLAAAHGIAANLEFLTPGEFVGRALAANPPPGEAPAADGRGASGVPGQVDNHYRRVFGTALLTSVISAAVQLSQPQQASGRRRRAG